MTNIDRVRVSWTGFLGGPGVSTFYTIDAESFLAPLHDWLSSMANNIPTDVTLQIEPTGDVIDPADGHLVDSWTTDVSTAITGAGAGKYAAPVGLCVNWLTGEVADGHRVRGKTFMVPCNEDTFDAAGQVDGSVHGSLQTICDTLVSVASPEFVVWHRPRAASVKHPVATAGSEWPVTNAVLSTKAAILTSRRD